jgi:hypothetical protein
VTIGSSREDETMDGTAFAIIGKRTSQMLSLAVAVAAALSVWLLFKPGILSCDSLDQYRQAATGAYDIWHPPIMAIMLSFVMRCGGGIGTLMLVQCVAGVLGIRALAFVLLQHFSGGRWTRERVGWAATLIAVLMLLPITPAAFYAMTFWKDSWTGICFLWIAAYGIWLFTRGSQLSRSALAAHFSCLATIMVLANISRHNVLIASPAMGAMLWLILARRKTRFSWLAIALPAVASIIVSHGIERGFHVWKSQPDLHVKMLDLVGICIDHPEQRDLFPYVSKHLLAGGEGSYRYGDVHALIDSQPPVISRSLFFETSSAELNADYASAIRNSPLQLLEIKWKAYRRLFDRENVTADYCHSGIDANSYGLRPDGPCETLRVLMYRLSSQVLRSRITRWISYHFVWFLLNIVVVATLLVLCCTRRGNSETVFLLCVMAVPLSYTASYFVATTGMDYRFLYPSTLFTQVAALSLACFCSARFASFAVSRFATIMSTAIRPSRAAATSDVVASSENSFDVRAPHYHRQPVLDPCHDYSDVDSSR